jgi:hypothetical protein
VIWIFAIAYLMERFDCESMLENLADKVNEREKK